MLGPLDFALIASAFALGGLDMPRRSRVSEALVVCPQCGHAFPLDRRERDLKQQAVERVLELERAERLGELTAAVRNLFAARRAMIAELTTGQVALRKEESALRKLVRTSRRLGK